MIFLSSTYFEFGGCRCWWIPSEHPICPQLVKAFAKMKQIGFPDPRIEDYLEAPNTTLNLLKIHFLSLYMSPQHPQHPQIRNSSKDYFSLCFRQLTFIDTDTLKHLFARVPSYTKKLEFTTWMAIDHKGRVNLEVAVQMRDGRKCVETEVTRLCGAQQLSDEKVLQPFFDICTTLGIEVGEQKEAVTMKSASLYDL